MKSDPLEPFQLASRQSLAPGIDAVIQTGRPFPTQIELPDTMLHFRSPPPRDGRYFQNGAPHPGNGILWAWDGNLPEDPVAIEDRRYGQSVHLRTFSLAMMD